MTQDDSGVTEGGARGFSERGAGEGKQARCLPPCRTHSWLENRGAALTYHGGASREGCLGALAEVVGRGHAQDGHLQPGVDVHSAGQDHQAVRVDRPDAPRDNEVLSDLPERGKETLPVRKPGQGPERPPRRGLPGKRACGSPCLSSRATRPGLPWAPGEHPVRWLEAVSVRDPPPCPTTAPAVSTGGRAAPADWLQLRGRPSRHAGRGGQRVFTRPLA